MKKLSVVLSVFLLLGITGCVNKDFKKEEIYEKSAFITKLVRKVQVGVRKNINDSEELYSFIQKRFPKIMKNFSEYSLKFKNHNNTAVVLMCDKDGKIALVEDISCSGAIDSKDLYKENLPCEFTLDVEKECSKNR